jgi:hypothetical protein
MRSEVLIAVNIKKTVFCDVMPCSLVGIFQNLGGTFSHHLQEMRSFSTLNMEAADFSQVLVSIYQPT